MKKSIKSVLILMFVVIGLMLFNTNSKAIEIDLNGTKDVNQEASNSIKIKSGEEVWLSVSIKNDEEKVMAMYGNIEYNKKVLEPVISDSNSNSVEYKLGDNWTIGDVSILSEETDENSNTGKVSIMFYTTNESRSVTVAYIKFKVKDDVKVKSAKFEAKDIVLYNTKYKEIQSNVENVTFNLKIYQNSTVIAIITIIVIIIILIIIVFLMSYKKNNSKMNEKNKEKNKDIKESLKTTVKEIDEHNSKENEKSDNNEIEKNSDNKKQNEEKEAEDKKLESKENTEIKTEKETVQNKENNENEDSKENEADKDDKEDKKEKENK